MIKGKKIILKAVETEDLDKLKDWRNNPIFRKNFREHRELNSINQDIWLKKMSKSSNDYMFSVFESKTQTLIGACGLLYIDWVIRSADLSIYIGKDNIYIDNHIGLDISQTLIEYGFKILNLNKIWMELFEFDDSKINFFTKKLNFKIDGRLRNNCYHDGKYYDSLIVSLLKNEF
tara:strand:- start:4122 stop:4646 length:525 start_codon:yes stop_codon:yes gene_type:complete